MRKIKVFNHVSLDGFIADAKGDMSWAHTLDPEFNDWVASNASGGAELVFGRVTYQQMVSFWPTPVAAQRMPVVAERMNNLPKVVFSKSLTHAEWNNTRLLRGEDIRAEVQHLKQEPGQDLVVMGSANLVSQLVANDLVDSLQLVLNPLALGAGKTMFAALQNALRLRLTESRTFKNGNVVLGYERTRSG
jgi:dihydrofolate reductase